MRPFHLLYLPLILLIPQWNSLPSYSATNPSHSCCSLPSPPAAPLTTNVDRRDPPPCTEGSLEVYNSSIFHVGPCVVVSALSLVVPPQVLRHLGRRDPLLAVRVPRALNRAVFALPLVIGEA